MKKLFFCRFFEDFSELLRVSFMVFAVILTVYGRQASSGNLTSI
jgi:hypothetical protein